MAYGLGSFRDERLRKGGAFLHQRLVAVGQRGIAVRSLGGNRAGKMRVTRLLRNENVRIEDMISPAREQTKCRFSGLHILAIQDTTSLRDDGVDYSLNVHPSIAVDAEAGTVPGLVHAACLKHEGGKKASRGKRSIKDKESQRWLTGSEMAGELVEAGAARVTVVADRESDIYEAFAQKPDTVELLVRASHDRVLASGDRLVAQGGAQPEAGRFSVDLPATPGRKPRQALRSVRHCRVEVKRPKNRSREGGLPEKGPLYVVEAREVNTPSGASPICWRLLTTHQIKGYAAARWVCGLYCRRWTIEERFRIMKTRGFDIERVDIAEGPFEKLRIAAIIAAVSILQLVRERDGCNNRPLEDVFQRDEQPALEAVCRQLEGKTARQRNPHNKGSLAYASWVCARLGGWTGYYGKPGPIVMLRGLHTFRAIQQGWVMAGNV